MAWCLIKHREQSYGRSMYGVFYAVSASSRSQIMINENRGGNGIMKVVIRRSRCLTHCRLWFIPVRLHSMVLTYTGAVSCPFQNWIMKKSLFAYAAVFWSIKLRGRNNIFLFLLSTLFPYQLFSFCFSFPSLYLHLLSSCLCHSSSSS